MGRKARMRKLLREEDIEDLLQQVDGEPEKEQVAQKVSKAATPVDRALDLQKAAGNRAVGAALDRWALPWVPQAAQQAPQWPKEPQLILDGVVIPLESYSETVNSPTSVGAGNARNPKDDRFSGPGEVSVVVELGDWSPELMRRALRGEHYKTAQIVIPSKDGKGVRWILTDVLISGYNVGGGGGGAPHESLTLHFQKREFAQTPPPKP
jgi:type VI protein secretion system component Hcp